MPKTRLSAVSRSQGNNRALKQGEVTLPDFELAFEEVDPLPRAFRRMVREGAWQVCEMALTTYVCAKAHGSTMVGLPIFLVRDFHHKSMCKGRGSGIAGPLDIEGRRVGVNRGYTVTTGVWARAILADEHGVDLSKVTWARSGGEHVAEYVPPDNVEELGGEGTLEEQLARGDIPAAVGLAAVGDGVEPLVQTPFEAGVAALRARGFWPINHLMVIRADVHAAHPALAEQLFDAFAASKRLYLNDLKAGRIAEPTPIDTANAAAAEELGDPLPYGVEPNLRMLEALMRAAAAQRIIPAPIPLRELFATQVLERVG